MDLTIEIIDIAQPELAAAFCMAREKPELICDRCQDSSELVIAVLEVYELDQSWALCGPCMRELPVGFQVT
jgi:hypothetical protein